MSVKSVKVSNVSLGASEQDIKEFFSFSGDIEYVEMQSGNERSQIAYVTFSDSQGAETAILLSGATIVDLTVDIIPAPEFELPPAASIPPAARENQSAGGPASVVQKAEDVVRGMLAKGFILGKDAVNKAKSFDEKYRPSISIEGKQPEEAEEEENEEAEEEEKEEEKKEEEKKKRKSLWTVARTNSLLDEWEKVGKKKFYIADWAKLAATLTGLLDITLNGTQCLNKMHSLKKDYMMSRGSGKKKWEFHDRLDSLFNKGLLTQRNTEENTEENIEERREKIEKIEKIEKKKKKIETSEEKREEGNISIIPNLPSLSLPREEFIRKLRQLILLTVGVSPTSKPLTPIIVCTGSSSPPQTPYLWKDQTIEQLASKGLDTVSGEVRCLGCQSISGASLDWRDAWVKSASFMLANLITFGKDTYLSWTPPSHDFHIRCEACMAMMVPHIDPTVEINWLFVFLTNTANDVVSAPVLEKYIRSRGIPLSGRPSKKELVWFLHLYMLRLLDPGVWAGFSSFAKTPRDDEKSSK